MALAALSGPQDPHRRMRAKRPVRVSTDLLPAVDALAAGAQPETQAEPHLAVNPRNPRNLIAGWQEHRFGDGGARALGVAASFDGGRTWAEAMLPGLTTATGGAWDRATDPWLAFDPDGRAYYSSMAFGTGPGSAIQVSVSDDGGLSWGAPTLVYHNTQELSDKQALTSDNVSGRAGRLHLAWMAFRYDPRGNLLGQALFSSYSDDGAQTWSAPHEHLMGVVNTGPVPAVSPDGRVYLVWLSQREGERYRQIYFARSRDGGATWTPPRRLEEIRFRRERNIREGNDLVAFAAHPATGELYILWADSRLGGGGKLLLMTSADRGGTWTAPTQVSEGPHAVTVFGPSLGIDGRGHVGISYFRGGESAATKYSTDLFFRDLGPDADAPAAEIRVTRRRFDIREAAFANGYFLGDYFGLIGLPRGFHLLWVDTSALAAAGDRRQPDVFASRVR
jgi:hypothetical protein